MPLETANYIYDLVQANPPDTDLVQQGDDHLRLLKKVIQQTWPNITGPNLPTSTGSANAHVVTHVYGPAAYSAGQMVTFKAGFTNTGPTTINVNGAGVTTLAQGGAAMVGGEIIAGRVYTAIYDTALTAFNIIGGTGSFLPLIGGTLTGNLTINPAGSGGLIINKPTANQAQIIGQTAGLTRWQISLPNQAAESGSNVGSDFVINRFNDAGANIDAPLSIARSTGNITTTGSITAGGAVVLAPTNNTALLMLIKAPGAFGSQILGQGGSGQNRWNMLLGNTTAETGGNAGSDFTITRYADNGTGIDTPLTITRANGNVLVPNVLTVGPNVSGASTFVLNGNASFGRAMNVYTSGSIRWQWAFGNSSPESGSNAGTDFSVTSFNDAGASLGLVYSAVRATRVVTFYVAIVNGPSDRTLKENIAPLEDSLEKVCALQGVSFNFIATPDKHEIGLIAQDVEPIVPEIIQDFDTGTDADGNKLPPKLALDYPKLIAHLVEAIKTLTARVEALETQLGGV